MLIAAPTDWFNGFVNGKSARSGVFNGFGPHDVPDVLQPGMVYMVTKGIRNIQVFQLHEHAAGSGCISYFQQVLFVFKTSLPLINTTGSCLPCHSRSVLFPC
jgi:hypothetical protein